MVNEEIIINDRKERANMINRIEVLEKVKSDDNFLKKF